jgi:hypothetical protein
MTGVSLPFCHECYTFHLRGPCPEDRLIEETRELALDYVENDPGPEKDL